MRRPSFLIFVNAMILLVVFALLTQALFVVQRLARAQVVTGAVEVQRGGRGGFAALARDASVQAGDEVRTGSDGVAEFTWADGTRWKVMPRSQLKIRKALSASRSEQRHLELVEGKVFVRLVRPMTPRCRFAVETPAGTAEARGTVFSVEAQAGATRVRVWKGEVALSNGDGHRATIAPGMGAMLEEKSVQTRLDAEVEGDFAREPSMVRPHLRASVLALPDGAALVQGEAEVGDEILVNGRAARVLGNGSFRLKFAPPLPASFAVVARDKHGQSTTWSGSLSAAPLCP